MSELVPVKRLILASASPRRRELLGLIGANFMVVMSRFDEGRLSHIKDGAEYVRAAAESKAEEVARRREGIILGVDTDVVAPDGEILGKPADADAAKAMLRRLSGKTHQVYSGIAVLEAQAGGTIAKRHVEVVKTDVTFASLSEQSIAAYVATGDPLDKAGAYGIQSGGLAFVAEVRGDLSSVIGLPITPVVQILTAFGVSLWNPSE